MNLQSFKSLDCLDQILRHCDVISKYWVFKIAYFVEQHIGYHPDKLHWPRLSGSNFTRRVDGGWKTTLRLTCSGKPMQSLQGKGLIFAERIIEHY